MSHPALRILILAAGGSTRMGGADKLLEPINGRPLMAQVMGRALATGLPVAVTCRSGDAAKLSLIRQTAATPIEVSDAASGQAASLRAYAHWARAWPAAAVMVMLADMPDIETSDLVQMIAAARAHPDRICRATSENGTPGHPVVFPQALVAQFEQLQGDRGAGALVRRHGAELVPLPGNRAVTDLDTPQDWAKWRAAQDARENG